MVNDLGDDGELAGGGSVLDEDDSSDLNESLEGGRSFDGLDRLQSGKEMHSQHPVLRVAGATASGHWCGVDGEGRLGARLRAGGGEGGGASRLTRPRTGPADWRDGMALASGMSWAGWLATLDVCAVGS